MVRRSAEWLALLLCAGSFAVYLLHSVAVKKYIGRYVTLLAKLAGILGG